MSAAGNFNMEDPAKQEQIRRGHHRYEPTAGRHGTYVPQPYKHQEYPKMMGKFPRPQRAEFKGKPDEEGLFQAAMLDWNRAMETTVVNSKAEEAQWMKENG
jgi:hypothetical protein